MARILPAPHESPDQNYLVWNWATRLLASVPVPSPDGIDNIVISGFRLESGELHSMDLALGASDQKFQPRVGLTSIVYSVNIRDICGAIRICQSQLSVRK
jgi:hypothetical protein